MVLWMIHEQDSLLAMGKLWSLDFVGADIDRLYIVFVTWPFISPECFKASSLEGFFSLSAWRMDSYTLGGLFVPILLGITHMVSMIHIIHIFRHHAPSFWTSELFFPRISGLFSDFDDISGCFFWFKSLRWWELIPTFSNAASDQCPSIRRSWQLPAEL